MILADSSVWIHHLRDKDELLVWLLDKKKLLIHPFVIGEIACGGVSDRRETLSMLSDISSALVASDSEVLHFIEQHQIMGRGIGYIDAHLLTAVSFTPSALLWTRDKRLEEAAKAMNLAYQPKKELH